MEGTMLSKPLLSPILHNEALTRGLGDMEARVLVEWLVEQAERAAARARGEPEAQAEVARLCRKARSIGRFVYLWGQRGGRGAAHQLAAAERFHWPLPTSPIDPCDLMHDILSWEREQGER
jgi:hypothetical protein